MQTPQMKATSPPWVAAARQLVTRADVAATTFVPMLIWSFGWSLVLLTVFPVEDILLKIGQPKWIADGAVIVILYVLPIACIVIDGAVYRATFGMRRFGLTFRLANGSQAGRLRCLLRIVAGGVLLPLLPVSVILGVWRGRGTTLADILVGTRVMPSSGQAAARPR
jgi:uncharacterized RDD family membrane protein YckC